jgi:hypothetical protein
MVVLAIVLFDEIENVFHAVLLTFLCCLLLELVLGGFSADTGSFGPAKRSDVAVGALVVRSRKDTADLEREPVAGPRVLDSK